MVAATLQEAIAQKGVTYIGGGTDIMPLLKNRVRDDENFVFLNKLTELQQVEEDDAWTYIGSGVTLRSISEDPVINRNCPAVAQAAAETASPQIRNIATIGGNIMQDRRCIYFNQSLQWRRGLDFCFKTGGKICHQIPVSPVCRAIYYSDVATGLIVYNAEVEYYENGELKREPVLSLVERHTLTNGLACSRHLPILVTRFCVPKQPEGTRSKFYKYCMRTTIDFPLVNFAALCGENAEPRIVVGAVSTMPVLLEKTAPLLKDGSVSDDRLLDEACKEIKLLARPIKEALIGPMVKRDFYKQIYHVLTVRHGEAK